MIKNIILKFGRVPNTEPLSIDTTPVTVFVGPNNSGKSEVLSEIYQYCRDGRENTGNVILENMDFEDVNYTKALEEIKLKPRRGENVRPNNTIVGKRQERITVNKDLLKSALQAPNDHSRSFCQWYLGFDTIKLDGKNRIKLVAEQGMGDLQENPHTSFQSLFKDDEKRLEVRRIIREAFGSYFVIDPTKGGVLRARLSNRAPKDNREECGLHDEAIKFHSNAEPIENASDGVKAFTGMITEIIAGDPKILLIDEPEAFLHPSLAHKLGKEIATATAGTNKRVFVSTHSSNFVMGCIQSGVPLNIVRLTYKNKVATARILPNDDVLLLMRDPLLRSTGVLEGLFYENVVVTEGDTDRAFYQEINERLLQFKPSSGISNCLFLNAQNKQTIRKIIKPLRELGIPAAGITDIDVLKEGGLVWTSFLKSGYIPQASHGPLSEQRKILKRKLEESEKDMKIDGGVAVLAHEDREAANNLFDNLDQYGLFTVRGGEVESWLKNLKATGHGSQWLIPIFEKMGSNPNSKSYLKPKSNDVWKFIKSLKKWFDDPNRKGIPS
ncbi:ATP-dependent nuclease [Sneathiella sp. HT1-7]|uniref:ATP-dependent nuclease n=1 Tax=Sneathiella sp. HT1-7 TaxID=2887192 RepID=UPI001D145C73|nr:AAA family ATPase [Sneathiella sp. HT1-7]MCC3305888.1 AAA family ATPase [Sneathiella sp. HT1-7]